MISGAGGGGGRIQDQGGEGSMLSSQSFQNLIGNNARGVEKNYKSANVLSGQGQAS